MDNLQLRVESDILASFWKDLWIMESPFIVRFPIFFYISDQTNLFVGVIGKWQGEVWELKWKRTFLFDYERVLIGEFLLVIRGFIPSIERDSWSWHLANDGLYFVSSAYSCLLAHVFPHERQTSHVEGILPSIGVVGPPQTSLCSLDISFRIISLLERTCSKLGFSLTQGPSRVLSIWLIQGRSLISLSHVIWWFLFGI